MPGVWKADLYGYMDLDIFKSYFKNLFEISQNAHKYGIYYFKCIDRDINK